MDALVWYEAYGGMEAAIVQEKAIKEGQPAWKFRLSEETSPGWRDLYDDLK